MSVVYDSWPKVFLLMNKIKKEIRDKNKNISVTDASKLAVQDPRYKQAYEEFIKHKENGTTTKSTVKRGPNKKRKTRAKQSKNKSVD
jgi:Na+-transporting NADH:ubiquinone oxidoreductase subunit NqrC